MVAEIQTPALILFGAGSVGPDRGGSSKIGVSRPR